MTVGLYYWPLVFKNVCNSSVCCVRSFWAPL